MVLDVLFWVLLLLAVVAFWVPEPYGKYVRGVDLILFIIVGFRVFPLILH